MANYYLGISAYYHDSAATLIKDGIPVAAAQEERFTRKRHDASFPINAIKYCLSSEGIEIRDVNEVVYYEDPKIKFNRILSSFASAGIWSIDKFSNVISSWLTKKIHVVSLIRTELKDNFVGQLPPITNVSHHLSHAASSFYPSPFKTAAVLCIDSVGEWHSTSMWHGVGNDLKLLNTISYPHSLGLLYSSMTYYCGFKVDSGEYKLMGLAPYGKPKYKKIIKDELIDLKSDGSFTLNPNYFEFIGGKRMIGSKFEALFGGPTRQPESPITQRECDLASSIQAVIEEAIVGLAKRIKSLTGEKYLCLAGGVALNCVANGVLSRSKIFEKIWIQPAAGDAGGSLGCAIYKSSILNGRPHLELNEFQDAMSGSLLGPSFEDEFIQKFLDENNYPYEKVEDSELFEKVSQFLDDGAVVGWFQDSMEFGPRALGARSIIGDSRKPEMQKTMNLKIKFRESFRPFAPSILEEKAADYFDASEFNPYMLMVSQIRDEFKTGNKNASGLGSINEKRSSLPAITHVDYSARVQSVSEVSNSRYYSLLSAFYKKTGCPVLVNTSFNVRGEPIVLSPYDAYTCFMRTGMDYLILGNFILRKDNQPVYEDLIDWRNDIPLD
jgi:carbamoyltransferase